METTNKPSESDRRGRQDLRYALHLLRRNPIVLVGVILSAGSIIVALLSPLLVNPTAWQRQPLGAPLLEQPALQLGEREHLQVFGHGVPPGHRRVRKEPAPDDNPSHPD